MSDTPQPPYPSAALDVTRIKTRALSDVEMAHVLNIKELGLAFIETCDRIGRGRELSLAKTNCEMAVMWGVKHITQ